jgi:Uncharacterised protein family (UPF0158)
MPVDRKALANALADATQTIHFIVDRTTEKILVLDLQDKRSIADIQKRMAADKARYVQIPKIKGRANFEEMERFIALMEDPRFKETLKSKLTSHKPFREFRDALRTKPKEERAWEKFHAETTDKRVTEFLRMHGLS